MGFVVLFTISFVICSTDWWILGQFCILLFYEVTESVFTILLKTWWEMCRFLESHWFVWVTQSNHIPMEVNLDQKEGWVEMQVNLIYTFLYTKKIL